MRRFIVRFLAVIGFLALLVAIGIFALGYWVVREARHANPVPEKAILRLAVHGNLSETDGASGALSRVLGRPRTTLRDVINALDRASADRRVLGLMVDLSDAQPTLAAAQELREAIARFRDAGKQTAAFADSFGEGSGSSQAFYLATAFDQIWLQPAGELGMTGFALDRPFFADALKKLGIEPRFAERWEFKGGIDSFTDMQYPAPLKASLQTLLGDLFDQLVDGIAKSRKLAPDRVRALIDQAPLFADEALKAGLIDAIGYQDEANAGIRRKTDAAARFVRLDAYLSAVGPPNQAGERIALIYGVGAVMRGDGEDEGGLGTSETLSAETVARGFRTAAADPGVRAILFRVDSPGGSYVASDTVWRAVKLARDAGKPVVASMGAVAASGGYFVSMGADRIIADPGTLTGSIGVYSGKFVLSGLWDKLGVNWDELKAGANAGLDSPNHDFTPEQNQRFQASLDRVYDDFTKRVASDRKIPAAKLDDIARGRVWTGRQAATIGLVDAIGGFNDALAAAKKLGGIATDAPVQLQTFPPERSPLDRALRLVGELDRSATALRLSARVGALLRPALERIGAVVGAQELSAPVDAR